MFLTVEKKKLKKIGLEFGTQLFRFDMIEIQALNIKNY